jgi:predicted ATPase/DNA-binding SARP family transcriptional activator
MMPDPTSAPLILSFFGPFQAWVNGQALPRLRSRKGQWILALLALRPGREVERAWLMGTLWPESSEALAAHSLRTSLTDLRRALGTQAGRLLTPTPRTLSLDLADAQVDVLAFDRAIARADGPSLAEAIALYRGPLLEGCVEEWIFEERQSREQAYLRALETRAGQAMAGGDPAAAERYLRRAVAVDPLRESVQRALMRALAAGGSYAAALLTYRELRLLLHREVNAEPDPETRSLFEQIRGEARRRAASPSSVIAPAPSEPLPRPETRREARPDLSADPSPEVPRGRPSHNLRLELTSFVGREREIAEVQRLLGAARLVTLTGAGGCGKTRLALQVAGRLMAADASDPGAEASRARETGPGPRLTDGVWLVELASLADPARVPQAAATVLGVRQEPDDPLIGTLTRVLREKQLLLVLDNCEHLVAACAQLAEALLRACSHLRILATSREALRVPGETRFRVPPLSLPPLVESGKLSVESSGKVTGPPVSDLSGLHSQLPTLLTSDAVRLFVDRAALAAPTFALTADTASAIAQICHRLDGIPLAIELAAARVSALPVRQIAGRLDDRFRLLAGGSRTAPPHQQTLRGLMDWSYDLLSFPERTLLRRLSVFAGGWTLEAAEAVCADTGDEEILNLLTQLVDKSLVIYEDSGARAPVAGGGRARYRLLETVRQYARDRLLEAEEAERWRGRHRDWFLELAEQAEQGLKGPEQAEWLVRLEAENDNLRAALEWSRERHEAEAGLRLLAALELFWYWRGYWAEGLERLAELLALPEAAVTPGEIGTRALAVGRARALTAAVLWALAHHRDPAAGRALAEESIALLRPVGDQRPLAWALSALGLATSQGGDLEAARSLQEESLALARQIGDPWLAAWTLLRLGTVAHRRGDGAAARSLTEESLALLRGMGKNSVLAQVLDRQAQIAASQGDLAIARSLCQESVNLLRELGVKNHFFSSLLLLGQLTRAQGDHATARSLFQESESAARELNNPYWIAVARSNLGQTAVGLGDLAGAASLFQQSLELFHQGGDLWGSAESLEGLASVAAARGQAERAARLFGAAETVRETARAPLRLFERPDYDRHVAAARAALIEDAFAAAWAEGRAIGLEQAIQDALDFSEPDPHQG